MEKIAHAQNGAIDAGWEQSRQNEVISRLKAGENLQSILENLPGFRESFRELDTIDCSDGRVLKGGKIGIAGSGILLSKEEKVAFIERYQGRIKELTTHRDCGAAKLAFAKLKPEEIPAGVTDADSYGEHCGKQLADALWAKHSFLEMEEMANEYHNESAIVLDTTGRFDSTHLAGFPAHFVCTGPALRFSEKYMEAEVETLAGIALGDHGFGHRFTRQDPFYFIVAARHAADQMIWERVARDVARKFDGRVEVKSFLSPEKQD